MIGKEYATIGYMFINLENNTIISSKSIYIPISCSSNILTMY